MSSSIRIGVVLLLALMGAFFLSACGGGDEQPARQGVQLPADFPSSDVPLVDGAILAASGSGDSWRVTIQANAADGNVVVNAAKSLTDNGYTESSRSGDNANQTVMLSKDTDAGTVWVNVGVSADAAAGPSTVFYQVLRTKKK